MEKISAQFQNRTRPAPFLRRTDFLASARVEMAFPNRWRSRGSAGKVPPELRRGYRPQPGSRSKTGGLVSGGFGLIQYEPLPGRICHTVNRCARKPSNGRLHPGPSSPRVLMRLDWRGPGRPGHRPCRVRLGPPMDQRDVLLFNFPLGEYFRQLAMRHVVLCNDKQSAGVLVETVDDTRAQVVLAPLESLLNRWSSALTSVPRLRASSVCPAPAWTIMPAGLFTIARSLSS